MSDYGSAEAPHENVAEQVANGDVSTHSVVHDTKSEFEGLANVGPDGEEGGQPITFYHSFFSEIFSWKYPKATGLVFFGTTSLILAFRFVPVLRYVFKGAYMLFFSVAALEVVSKPLTRDGIISSMRPKRYYTLPRDSLERLFATLHDLTNFFILEFQRVLFVENIFTTIAAFVASFFGYFLVKYIGLWGLMLLTTWTAFTAPFFYRLVYLNNQEFIDEKIQQVTDLLNAQIETGKKLSEEYAGDAIAKARATAMDLSHKVQGYTGGAHKSSEPAKADGASDEKHGIDQSEFPSAPTSEPVHEEKPLDVAQEPIMA